MSCQQEVAVLEKPGILLFRIFLSPGENMKISILIVCYNSADDIEKCLASIYRQSLEEGRYEVLLINNSDDDIEGLIRDRFVETKIVPNNQNLGFGRGCNVLASKAAGDYLLLLNPDTELHADALVQLMAAVREYPAVGAWGGSTYFPSGELEPSSNQRSQSIGNEVLKLFGLTGLTSERTLLKPGYDSAKVLSGAFMMVSRRVWNRVGGFDESFFLYAEEVDLCSRIRKLTGLDLVITDRARATHYVGASSAPSYRTVHLYRGKMHLARKSSRYGSYLVYFVIFWVYGFTRTLMGCMARLTRNGKPAKRLLCFARMAMRPDHWFGGYSKE